MSGDRFRRVGRSGERDVIAAAWLHFLCRVNAYVVKKDDSPLTLSTHNPINVARLRSSSLIRTRSASEAKRPKHSLPTGKSNIFSTWLLWLGHVTQPRSPVSSDRPMEPVRICENCRQLSLFFNETARTTDGKKVAACPQFFVVSRDRRRRACAVNIK